MRNIKNLSFRPERADAFSSRSLPVNASACAVEVLCAIAPWRDESLFAFVSIVEIRQLIRRTDRKEL